MLDGPFNLQLWKDYLTMVILFIFFQNFQKFSFSNTETKILQVFIISV